MFYVIFIPLTIVSMGFMTYMWRKEVREWGIRLADNEVFFFGTFIAAPIGSFVITIELDITIREIGFWLIPITLLVGGILTYVYWDEIKRGK